MPPQPTRTTDTKPLGQAEEGKHPLSQLRTLVQEQLRGQAAKISVTCRECETAWNGSEAVLPILHYSYQNEVRRLERMILQLGARLEQVEKP